MLSGYLLIVKQLAASILCRLAAKRNDEAGDDDVGHGDGSRNFQPKPMSWS